jgi:hypothetical protein
MSRLTKGERDWGYSGLEGWVGECWKAKEEIEREGEKQEEGFSWWRGILCQRVCARGLVCVEMGGEGEHLS